MPIFQLFQPALELLEVFRDEQISFQFTYVLLEPGNVVRQIVKDRRGGNVDERGNSVRMPEAGFHVEDFLIQFPEAGEVRTLAQRSSAAAKEIKELIEVSVDRVQIGSGLVDKAGETMVDIISAIRRVTDIMGEIAAASEEQSAGIEQVGRAVTQMDEVTQQNAALVEEAAAAAQSLEDQTDALRASVEKFRLSAITH